MTAIDVHYKCPPERGEGGDMTEADEAEMTE